VQLQGHLAQFEAAGLGVAVLTYDAPLLQRRFIDRFSIAYPMLSDIDATSVVNLGVLNTDYQRGDASYGIPYPGVFVIDPAGTIVGKIFVAGYTTRVDADGDLKYALSVLPRAPTGASQTQEQ
jgi:peroxiredoxin